MSSTFDSSPRPAKKRKVTNEDQGHSSSPIKRTLRTLKQAFYGKASGPKINGEVFDLHGEGGEETPSTPNIRSIGHKIPADGQRGNMTTAAVKGSKSELPQDDKRKNGGGGDGAGRKTSGRTKRSQQVVDGSDSVPDDQGGPNLHDFPSSPRNPGRTQTAGSNRGPSSERKVLNKVTKSTPKGQKKKQPKGWVYVNEEDELGHNDDLEGAEEGEENAIGRVKRGRNDLRIDMNLEQLKPRREKHAMKAIDAQGSELEDAQSGKRGRKSGRVGRRKNTPQIPNATPKFSSKKKQSREAKSLESKSTPPDEDGGLPEDSLEADESHASTDELANGIYVEHSEQELMQTSTQKSKNVPGTAKQRKPNVSTAGQEELLFLAAHEVPDPDLSDSAKTHAQALHKIFEDDPTSLESLKARILPGLTGKRPLPLINLENEHQKVSQLVEQTILAGEGNSMLIIGSRGSGKTTLVETVISDLTIDHGDQFHVVRLNGFIHTDDKLALREIWRQLGREMDVQDDDLGTRSNYADTLISLLALLAHPANEAEENSAAAARSVIFILDEFDLFAAHPRQTLLYNLFDVAQSRNAPIAILGLTTKVNVVDTLEKRVKSRFGQRYVHLSLPKSFAAYQSLCLSALSYNPSSQDILHHHQNHKQQNHKKTSLHSLSSTWNHYLTTLFSTPILQNHLRTLYTQHSTLPPFLTSSLLPIALLTPTTLPTPSSFLPANNNNTNTLLPPDNNIHLLPSLSTLALSLLISAARLDIILDTNVCTFEMVYEEYVTLASKAKTSAANAGQVVAGGRVWGAEVARGEWEGLGRVGVVVAANGGGGGGGRGRGELWKVDVGLEEVGAWLEGQGGRGGVLGRWCREI